MKRTWELEELIDPFTFLPNELSLIAGTAEIRLKIGNSLIFKYIKYFTLYWIWNSVYINPITGTADIRVKIYHKH